MVGLSAVEFEWDMGNIAKVQSRMDLATAEFAFHGRPYVAVDDQHSQGEKRWQLVNKVGNRFIFIVFTLRKRRIRIISARFMRRREYKAYEKWFEED